MATSEQLPANWIKSYSKTRKLDYYYNSLTQQSVWTLDEVFSLENILKSPNLEPSTSNKRPISKTKPPQSSTNASEIIPASAKLTPNEIINNLKMKKNQIKVQAVIDKAPQSREKPHKVSKNRVQNDDIERKSNKKRSKSLTRSEIIDDDVVLVSAKESKDSELIEFMDWEIIENEINDIRRTSIQPDPEEEPLYAVANQNTTQKTLSSSSSNGSSLIYTILDTNILITNLKDLKDLIEQNKVTLRLDKSDLMIVMFIVPWVTIKELDALKVRVNLETNARLAIDFLLVQASKKEFIRFQTSSENDEILSEINCCTNDDFILKCALKAKKTHFHSKVLLLTNDKNLQTKALITDLSACSFDKFKHDFNQVTQNTQHQENSFKHTIINQRETINTIQKQISNETSVDSIELLFEKTYDYLQIEIKSSLIKLFSFIYKNEMIHAYEDTWLDIVFVKPPWDLNALNTNITRHYAVLFGFTLPSDAKQYWTSFSNCAQNLNSKTNLIANKMAQNCEYLKFYVKMIAEGVRFLNTLDRSRYSSEDFWSLVNYVQILSSTSLKIYKIFSFYYQNSSNLNDTDQQLHANCFDIFHEIWKQYFELCQKLSYNGFDDRVSQREICFYAQFYSTLMHHLKESFESCLNYSNDTNLLRLTQIIFLLYYLFGIKSFEASIGEENNFSHDFKLARSMILKCFRSLNHSETMRNGLKQLHEFSHTIAQFKQTQQRVFMNNLMSLDAKFLP